LTSFLRGIIPGMETIQFGEHLTLDGYGGDLEALNSKERVYEFLDKLPGMLDMIKMGEPVLYHSEGNDLKDPGGWTGVVVIAESHISVHTFAKRGFVSADVYTCKNGMNNDLIIDFFKKQFKVEDVETHFIKRGVRYPAQNIY
jgi:S-adenosylmethionine decarboxylase